MLDWTTGSRRRANELGSTMPILGTGSGDWQRLDSRIGGLPRVFSSSEVAMEPRDIGFAFVILVG